MTAITHSTKQDILQYLLKEGQATAHELAKALELSQQAIRRHLYELEAEGDILHESTQIGMGRPQHIYHLSRQGRDRFPNRYGEFAIDFLDTLAETVGEKKVVEVLRLQWQKKADEYRDLVGKGSLQQRIQKLVSIRRQEGYMTELHELNQQEFVIAEHNCVISEVAESYPMVCGNELEMFAAILPDSQVERTHWMNNGEHNCGYSIKSK
jgi:DeoR family suf operon transcriptional repressor